METKTETNQNNRELTKTEIKITLAQIEDRLTRAINARIDCVIFDESQYQKWAKKEKLLKSELTEDEQNEYEKQDNLERAKNEDQVRVKYDIPDGVFLFPVEGLLLGDIKKFMKFAKWWIEGKMDDEIFSVFHHHYEEVIEVDYVWVLMGVPSFYYDNESLDGDGHDKLIDELKNIGTRSKNKAKLNFKLHIGHDILKQMTS